MSEHGVNFARGFSLHEALALMEDDENDAGTITLLPPNNAFSNQVDWDSEDEVPLSELKTTLSGTITKLKKMKGVFQYGKDGVNFQTNPLKKSTDYSPMSLFFLFFEDELLEKITEETNIYASQKNKSVIVEVNEVKIFIVILLLSGYVSLPRTKSDDSAPTDGATTEVKDTFFEELGEKFENRRHLILLGDFNGRIGKEKQNTVVGQYGDETLNDSDTRLIELCQQYSLRIQNRFFQHREIYKYTWEQKM
ncbi:hypothetical protein ILUMI_10667 [Ignelater luminosus]|uniref:PiggyBac transposable element-derived protein domain-containing protein n=1 Tax=Ignelater luminosus TaxID=2038154 RepID=A0A8K0CZZ0_IGNLU|nr:hypothetical protein ILUMI_10667 [Ignelater luminosus]